MRLAINETIQSGHESFLSAMRPAEHNMRLNCSAEINQRNENEARPRHVLVSQDA